MTAVGRARVELRMMSPPVAAQVTGGRRASDWAVDYPAEGDLVAARMYLRQCAEIGDPQPFGPYQVIRLVDHLVVGGAGFHGRPIDGTVEIGYGIVPSARGTGLATEAARQLIAIASGLAVRRVMARTEWANPASVRVLERIGMRMIAASGEVRVYELLL
ncbi:MAG TPA: GNAT family N-acetyltransferase [Candidatus Limnocylindrales bacterium]|nr:GNAT family N-acetyltransferase [Candidatus Limnocylindrales bacterium]